MTGTTQGYFKCYSEHLNYVSNCVLSSDKKLLLTASEMDKSIFLWTIMKADEEDAKFSNDDTESGINQSENSLGGTYRD